MDWNEISIRSFLKPVFCVNINMLFITAQIFLWSTSGYRFPLAITGITFTWTRSSIFESGPSRIRSRNNPRVFEIGDHLLVNDKFETGFLNPGRTVIDPLTDRTLPNASSQPSRVRLRNHEAKNKKPQSPANSSSREEYRHQFRILTFDAYLFPGHDQGHRWVSHLDRKSSILSLSLPPDFPLSAFSSQVSCFFSSTLLIEIPTNTLLAELFA